MTDHTPYSSGPENFDPVAEVESLARKDMFLKIGSSAATISQLGAELVVERRISEDRAVKLKLQAATIADKDEVIAEMSAKIVALTAQIDTMMATSQGGGQ